MEAVETYARCRRCFPRLVSRRVVCLMSVFLGALSLLLIVALVVYEVIQGRRLASAEREWSRK